MDYKRCLAGLLVGLSLVGAMPGYGKENDARYNARDIVMGTREQREEALRHPINRDTENNKVVNYLTNNLVVNYLSRVANCFITAGNDIERRVTDPLTKQIGYKVLSKRMDLTKLGNDIEAWFRNGFKQCGEGFNYHQKHPWTESVFGKK